MALSRLCALVLKYLSTNFRLILKVLGSISTKTGFAPTVLITSAVAIKVKGVVITSSPGPIPSALKDNQSASVPELTPIAYFVQQN